MVVIRGFEKGCISNSVTGRESEEEIKNANSDSDEVGNGSSEGGEVVKLGIMSLEVMEVVKRDQLVRLDKG